MKLRFSILVFFIMLLAACSSNGIVPNPSNGPTASATLRDPMVNTTAVPDAQAAASKFLEDWKAENYSALYSQLTLLSKDAVAEAEFVKQLRNIATTMSLRAMDFEILQSLVKGPTEAQVAYRISYDTVLVGELSRDTMMTLSLQDGQWRVQWEDGMILPELRGGNRLSMDITIPTRGNIYDANGSALAAQSDAVALGIVPGQIEDGSEGALLVELADLTGLDTAYIRSLYEYAQPDWYIPVGDASAQAVERRASVLDELGGLVMTYYNTRYYFNSTAPHVTGYVQLIPEDQLDNYKRRGYRGDEFVGMAGLEEWGEEKLAGQRGASLYVVDQQGGVITRLAQRDSAPAYSITTTIDKNFQMQVQRAIQGFRGAVVVLERDTGRVLAMASSPPFNPNLFDPNNFNSGWMLGDVFDANSTPLINRAAQSSYPLGSVFKIITMAAALESGIFTPYSSYYCDTTFTELPGITLYDWTFEKEKPASGDLTLPEGLMRSCNPWFYHIGLIMYETGFQQEIAKMARGFGLGSPTGIEQIEEVGGNIADITSANDAVQMAIGQGSVLVTPLQVANFIAAVGNGGTLYRPQVVESVETLDGDPVYRFEAEEIGKLPVSAENLKVIQDAMRTVVTNTRGTAYIPLVGLQMPIYAKTGTATNPNGKPHAWFSGYTNSNREDLPDIAIAVIAENAGEGSEVAAPIFRRVIEAYYYGKPLSLYRWESSFHITRTPTPLVTETPQPEETETPQP